MIVRKPAILIYTYQPDPEVLHEVCAGIEEEGLLYEISEQSDEDIHALAFSAAKESILGSGIGISKRTAAMQMARQKQGQNVFLYYTPTMLQCRILGANSARAVKKVPFKEEYNESSEDYENLHQERR